MELATNRVKMATSALVACSLFLIPSLAQASWYWPFGQDEDKRDLPRLSELMEPATTNIDAAADFAAEGKFREAQDCYRAAIAALQKIESENPERATTPEFATVRNKRAYVSAALDSMLLAEARDNAKAVAVTDTTELEKRLVLKPWREFLPTYVALTNADRLVEKRLQFVNSPWSRELLNAVTDPRLQTVCVSNCNEIGLTMARRTAARDRLARAYREADESVRRLEMLAEKASTPERVRILDVCKADARKGIAACTEAWPAFGDSLAGLNRNLEGLLEVMCAEGAARDFPEIAKLYAQKMPSRSTDDAEALAKELGYSGACQTMLGELDAARAGVVYRGALYRIHTAWGGEEVDAPQLEEDRGLVKNEGESRPKVESQGEKYVEKERKRAEKVKRVAAKAQTRRAVQAEVKKLMEADPKSRKARLLMAAEDLRNGDTAAAKAKVAALLDERPNDGPALNMRAAIEAAEGDLRAAEKTLDQVIQSNPRDYHAYYNMANVFIQKGNLDSARRYYETGRAFAGPKNAGLEGALDIK